MATYHEGDTITGTVTGVEEYGIFLSFDDNQSGLIHISEISDSFVKNVNDYAQLNDKLTAKVIGIDEDGHYKLSIKELEGKDKKDSHHIVETDKAFSTLKARLPEWIEEAYQELEK
ncbi:MAG: S1 RNA-binding domain-containing protein [Bacilli bacterium]|nr:S1 RNA-binding domain-containing protein [Bacilli bacterium]